MLDETMKWSMVGANAFISRIASIVPSGYAGLIVRTRIVTKPTRMP